MFNSLKTLLLFTALTGLFIVVGQSIGGSQGATIAFGVMLAINLGSYWFSDKIVLKMYKGKEVDLATNPQLYQMVERLSQNAGLPMPKVYTLPSQSPNAFATGRNPSHSAVAFSDGLLNTLSQEEIAAVAAHELAHIKNRDTLISTVVASIAGAISMLANIMQWALIFGGGRDRDSQNPLGALVTIIIAPIAAFLIQMAISRSREFAADAEGARIHGKPLDLANALAKLHNMQPVTQLSEGQKATAHMFIVSPLRGKALSSIFSTHPDVNERIKRLQEMTIR